MPFCPASLPLRIKPVLALAALCLAGAAHGASSDLTLYGIIDLGIAYERLDGQSRLAQRSGGQTLSYWGLRGAEDLGNGYRAFFQLESGFHATDGSQMQERPFGRWAYLGVAGPVGELRLGRLWTLGNSWGNKGTPFGNSWSGAAGATTLGYNDGDFGAAGRSNNTVMYLSPTVNGWQAGVGYSFEAHDSAQFATARHDRVLTSGIRYQQGPLAAALTYERLNAGPGIAPQANASVNAPPKRNASNMQVVAAYELEWVTVHGGYGLLRHPNVGPSAGYGRVQTYLGGVSVPVSGRGKVLASYQRATRSSIQGWAMGYQHDLSKRTNLYALVDRIDRRDSHLLQTMAGIKHAF